MKTKKLLSMGLSVLLASSIFIGCGDKAEKPASAEGEKATITYWQHSSPARDKMMESLAQEFMKKNTNIEVKLEFIPEDSYNTKLISSLATDAAPDVMQIQSGMINRLAKANAIQPLDENVLSTKDIKNEFIPATVNGLQVDGKYYGLPTDTQTIVAFWNKDLVKQAGLDSEKGPQTWDEMLNWAKKLTKRSTDGKMEISGWGVKGYHPEVQALILQNGGKIVDEDGKYIFADDPKAIEAMQYMVGAYKKDKVYDTKFMKNWAGFRQGKIALMLGHPAMIGNLKQTAPNVKLGLGLIPAKNGKHTTVVTSWGYAISKKANAQAATKWIEFLTSADAEKKWTKQTGELPARKKLLEDSELNADPQLKIVLSSLKDSEVGYVQMGILNKYWSEGFEEILLKDVSVKDGLKKIQNKINEEIAKDIK
ncbi:ABC transporter substrate-binding protein [Clostridium lundense]|uniref:ABC transporter substrate-binding protein n=1 Tax=Clostridium lundense TaxID=319475 RepID=UPI0004834AC3|nr:ABC transporter substrate-binding protein [Clostridium lundense]